MKRGFSLIELLVTIAIIALMVCLALPFLAQIHAYMNRTACLSNMRQVGVGLLLYTADNDSQFPPRTTAAGADRWPRLVYQYISNPKNFIDPGDTTTLKLSANDLMSNSGNRTSFFVNGFNDVGAYTDPNLAVRMSQIDHPQSVILLAEKLNTKSDYYMDLLEPPHGNQNDVLNKETYNGGSNYVFTDGSARFLKKTEYSDQMWLVNPSFPIPVF